MIFITDNSVIKWNHDGMRYCLHIKQDPYPLNPRKEFDGNIATIVCQHSICSAADNAEDLSGQELWERLVRKHCTSEEIMEAALAGKIHGVRIEETQGFDPANPCYDIYETYSLRTVLGNTEPSEKLEFECVCKDTVPDYIIDDVLAYSPRGCMELLKDKLEWSTLWCCDHSAMVFSCSKGNPYYEDSGACGMVYCDKKTVMEETRRIVRDAQGNPIKETHHHDGYPDTYSLKTEPVTEETWRQQATELMEAEAEDFINYLEGEVYGFKLYSKELPGEDGIEYAWDDDEEPFCFGFYGDDLMTNGIIDEVGCGLKEALLSGNYEHEMAQEKTVINYDFGD